LWYGNVPEGDQNQGNEWESQATSTWQSEHLPDGSAGIDIQEEKGMEMFPEENFSEDHVGLTIEEDEEDNQYAESPSVFVSGSAPILSTIFFNCISVMNIVLINFP
jgi:hypothetical protein